MDPAHRSFFSSMMRRLARNIKAVCVRFHTSGEGLVKELLISHTFPPCLPPLPSFSVFKWEILVPEEILLLKVLFLSVYLGITYRKIEWKWREKGQFTKSLVRENIGEEGKGRKQTIQLVLRDIIIDIIFVF